MYGREARFYVGKNSYPGGSAAGSAGRSVGCDALHLGVCGLDGKAGLLGVHGVAAGHGVGLRRGFCGSALVAFWKKEQGLLTGLLLGGLFAAALSGLLLMSGGLFDTPALLRMAAVLLCSCAGGVLGRALGEKKRRI